MFIQSELPTAVTVTQGSQTVTGNLTQSSQGEWLKEIDESVILPLTDLVYTFTDLPIYSGLGLADSLVFPVFIGLTDAGRYFKSRLHGGIWATYTSTKQTQALITSTSVINSFRFKGCKSYSNQELEFPRGRLTPPDIRYATAELALSLAQGNTLESKTDNLRVTSRRFSGVGTTLAAIAAPDYLEAGVISIAAWGLLQPYLRQSSGIRIYKAS